ncbi:asparagine synthase (glutamine-hydrolyzing) [Roseibacillus ishigakijimensis]|uniref:asparagine synthase (glutamine-hydrolyzing) n=1 Tax=Roseibacillus ishigakijimensis TaxID=454146 RepID=A0A934VLU9_9BACT|nr:asparagine synthase (glutamine-hydrolyzing) [Roseibacillus ishigakijimensis]MBK1833461.1 asparagine synthase (glutamine-hydrolyzing) [Roseibacillus ishigakijimensis]
MCGICGSLGNDPSALRSVRDRLAHRGPDDRSLFSSGSFVLGMTRLAILDPESGQQPFTSADGQVRAICNGEIYNWRELRQELESRGHRFHTRCDCEILPAAWQEWGPELAGRLNGMFALAIHDAATDSLYLARDRCGQKPLYYCREGGFHFASEVKALQALGLAREPDPTQLASWLSLRYLPEPATLFRGLTTLPAAHWMTVSAGGDIHLQRYWEAGKNPAPSQETRSRSPLDELDHFARSAVELALHAEVPLAAYLSGGVDSALLAHYLRELGAEVTTVSLGFGAASDETAAAQATADHLGLLHEPTFLRPESLRELPRVVAQMDRPVGDALILAFDELARHTAALGCRVALGGEGPDEHFAGYSFQKAFLLAQKLGPCGRPLAATAIAGLPTGLLDRFARFPASLGPEGRAKTARYLRDFGKASFFQQATGLHTLFAAEDLTRFLHPDLRALQQPHPLAAYEPARRDFSALLALQYRHWLPDWSLIRQDKNAMAHSLEYRAPFLDHRLIDFALAQAGKGRPRPDKALWRELAARHLPRSLTQRPKQPFYLPLEQPAWRAELLRLAREHLAPSELAKTGWLNAKAIEPLFSATTFLPLKQLAALLILQIWLLSFSPQS